MAPPHTFDAPDQGSSFGRARDARVEWLLETHPATANLLAEIGWFPSRKKAAKRLRRLALRGRVRLVGTVCRKAGRPEHVYCRWRVPGNDLLHEIRLTELCLRLHAGRIDRGPHVTDRAVRPDAEVWINGELYYLELDRGTMGLGQMERRFRRYEGCSHLSLWVCSSPARAESLRRRAGALRHTALFSTLAEAAADPHAAVWVDCDETRGALPRHQGGDKAGVKPGAERGPLAPPGGGGLADGIS
jgi:hypothetical protein